MRGPASRRPRPAIVAVQSIVIDRLFGGSARRHDAGPADDRRDTQRRLPTDRIFWNENGQLNEYRSPPLSLVKMTQRVALELCARASARRTRPMPASMLFIIAA